jgi:hypothetical protein
MDSSPFFPFSSVVSVLLFYFCSGFVTQTLLPLSNIEFKIAKRSRYSDVSILELVNDVSELAVIQSGKRNRVLEQDLNSGPFQESSLFVSFPPDSVEYPRQ